MKIDAYLELSGLAALTGALDAADAARFAESARAHQAALDALITPESLAARVAKILGGGSGEKMPPGIPFLRRFNVDKSKIRFVDQSGCLQCLA